MKRLGRTILTVALVLVLALPLFAGCSLSELFGKKEEIKEGISIYSNFKTEYEIGDELDVTDGKIQYTNEEGKKTIVEITKSMITSFSTETAGSRQMIVTYNGNTITVNYTVYKVYDIEIGALYYCHPSQMTAMGNLISGQNEDPNTRYDYISFSSSNSVSMAISTKAPQSFLNEAGFGSPFVCTSNKVNHKKVYTFTTNTGAVCQVTAVNETSIHIVVNSELENVHNFEIDLVKYLAA